MREKLNKYAKNITSQYGEDGILDYLIRTSKKKINKSCFEVGAGDGYTFSNTYSLWHSQAWRAILVESNPERYLNLINKFSDKENLTIVPEPLNIFGKNSVDQLALKYFPPTMSDIGVLSIDIDSFDYHVFKNIKKIKPMIVLVEFNNSIPPHIDYYDPIDEIFLRCSAKSLERVGLTKGYKLVATTVTNVIFIRDDCFNSNKHPDAPIEYLFDYEGQRVNNSIPTFLISSQLISSYPIFSKKVKPIIKFLFILRSLFATFIGKADPWKKPSKKMIQRIKKSGMNI